ncbi:hypothetical protein MRB53_015489 [Persea americana]|uniref:Uncharacterized protein n=1 Tax=Persea americana TaxID=3435 RepID=A0ACC2LZE7_PERAE|nr:hypothetical protein MRB53_015489 [Persea americana]
MYAEAGIVFPYYFQSFSQEVEDLCRIHETNATSNPVQTSIVSEYDLGGEGDLFKAPEPIIEEPELELDPMAAAMSVISNSEDAISTETIRVTDIESIQSEHLLSEVFYECKKDLLAKTAVGEPFAEASSDVEVPAIQTEGGLNVEKEQMISEVLMQKSVSSGSLSSVECVNGSGTGAVRPTFLDFQTMDLGAALGMRKAYSEGDIQVRILLLQFISLYVQMLERVGQLISS